MTLGEFFFKYRGITPLPLVLIIVYFARPTPQSFFLGLMGMLLGEAIRLWGVSYAGGATRTRQVGAPRLVTNGPFAYVRNPLYLGNMLIYTGAAIIPNVGTPWLLFIVWIYFGFQYYWIVRLEEQKLTELFGSTYRRYQQQVPRFFPRFSPAPPAHPVDPDLKAALKSEKSTFLSFLTILLLFYLKMRFVSYPR